MTTGTFTRHRSIEIPRPELHLAGWIAIAFLIVLGVGALGGGIALAARPDGSVMSFDVELLAGSPFTDYFVPGLILGACSGSARSPSRSRESATGGSLRSSPSRSAAPR